MSFSHPLFKDHWVKYLVARMTGQGLWGRSIIRFFAARKQQLTSRGTQYGKKGLPLSSSALMNKIYNLEKWPIEHNSNKSHKWAPSPGSRYMCLRKGISTKRNPIRVGIGKNSKNHKKALKSSDLRAWKCTAIGHELESNGEWILPACKAGV